MNLNLDMTTVIVFIITGHVLTMILVSAYRHGQNKDQAINAFYAAKWLQVLGWGLSIFRGWAPGMVTITAANCFLLAGAALEAISLLRATDAYNVRIRRAYMALTGLCMVVFCFIAAFADTERNRILAASAGLGLLLIIPAVKMIRNHAGSVLRRITGCLYFLVAAGSFIRGIVAVSTEASWTLFEPGILQTVSSMSMYCVMFIGNTGFILLSKEKADRELHKLASYDDLTGIRNRRTFIIEAKSRLAYCEKKAEPLSFLLMDVDHFKSINDTYGHDVGDEVLIDYACELQAQLRPNDVLGRYGGDEFAVLLPGAGEAECDTIAENIRSAMERIGGRSGISFTVSIGAVTAAPGMKLPLERLYKLADNGLYKAKQKGRNQMARSRIEDGKWKGSPVA